MKNKNKQLVSVVMPAYNAEKYIAQAIESILAQTYQNFEFVIVDDASTDKTWNILKKYAKKDKRIKIFQNPFTMKAAMTVDRAIFLTQNPFIARMDADDIAAPDRLEKQLTFLLSHKDVVCVGGQCILINENNDIIGEKTFPTNHSDIYSYIFRFIPIQQPAMMIAKERLPKDFDYYKHGMSPVEDVEFIFKLFKYGKVENLPDYLLYYRIHTKNSSRQNVRKSFYLTAISRFRSIVLHKYRPTPFGVFITLLQTVAVLLLPEKTSIQLYNMIKRKTVFENFFAFNIQPFSLKLKLLNENSLYQIPYTEKR